MLDMSGKYDYWHRSSSIASAQLCNSQSRANAAYLRDSSIARLGICRKYWGLEQSRRGCGRCIKGDKWFEAD